MKSHNIRTALLATATFGALSLVSAVNAQTSVTTTTSPVTTTGASTTTTSTTTSEGTIQSFTPGSSQIILRSSSGAPATYSYSKTTTFVDGAGNAVSYETIRPGEPTTVYYAVENGQQVVSKVVVNRTAAAPVTRTTETTETTTTTHKK